MQYALKQPGTDPNPLGTDGFEFIEFTAPDPVALNELFLQMGFTAIGRHRHRPVILYRQGDIHFMVSADQAGYAARFAREHGPSVCAMAIRVSDAPEALHHAEQLGARRYSKGLHHELDVNIPAVYGIGDCLLYLVDPFAEDVFYQLEFESLFDVTPTCKGAGLVLVDHLTHNVHRGHMDTWAKFYSDIFNFREIRYFNIQGQHTGLVSRAMTSPCGKIRIPINESTDDNSQIEEFIRLYNGEGIQHIALATEDIYATVEDLRARGVQFMDVPDTYYEDIDARLPGHGEDIERLRRNRILIDGNSAENPGGLLLQIFTEPVIGPVFFEIIQRKGDEGFGEGNFQALFEAIERDQVRRGVIGSGESG